MNKFKHLEGIIPPVSTIFDESKNLNKKGMGDLIDYLIKGGVHGLLFLGSGGEFSQMALSQRKEVAEFCISHVNQRVPVFIGTGSTSTQESVLLSQHAQNEGADGVMIINPYYWSLPEESLLNHYLEIANAIDLPILLYNFPDLTGQDLSPEFVLKLVNQTENIVGIKETIDSIGHIREMITKVKGEHSNFKVFAGLDDHLLNTLQMGGDGAIPGTVNFAPEIAIGIYNSYKSNDYKQAEQLQRKLMKLLQIYKLGDPLYSAIKEATKIKGVNISTQVLPPAQNLQEADKKQIKEILESALS